MTDEMNAEEPTKTPIFRSLHEAAEYIKVKPRTLAKAARKIGACSVFGRDLVFSEDDIKAILEANRAGRKVSYTMKAPPSQYQAMKRLEKLLAKKPRKRNLKPRQQ
ncbi:hypothetical protein HNQ36_003057 [Afipia massiliensis]|uniref:Uncharacterized protein n=1 Tax=Afipia massiliensis TaxID=211460 RepID=A0A840N8P4_9BRAD|nr:hypothetical protein [Afipia massiliensis]MBB5053066.1 hypothetical protein [Afipia massiliensis]